MKLNVRQKKFADMYIKTLNGKQSYLYAYNCKESTAEANSSSLLKNNKVRYYIENRMKKKEKSKIASQTEILEILTEFARGKTKEEVINVVFVEKGVSETTKDMKKISAKDRIAAMRELTRRNEFLNKTKIEREKLKLQKELLEHKKEIDRLRIKLDNNDEEDIEAIKDFIEKTKMTTEESKEIFDDEEDE